MKDEIKNILGLLGALLSIALIAFLGVEIYNRAGSGYDLSNTRSISMSAEGKVTARPDLATLSFSVVTQGKDAARVQTDNDAKMNMVIDFLKENSVAAEDIETSGYNLYPQYDYSRPETSQQIIGYNLNQNVTVKIRTLDTVSKILGGLTAKGVNQINNVSYSIDDPDKLKADARNQAIDKAKDKASELADRLGVRLGSVINFAEGGSYVPGPIYYDRALGVPEGLGGGSSPVEPGTQDISVSVTLTFVLK